jgi:hypothetical protein
VTRTACDSPVAWETLVDYWAGDLAAAAEGDLESHLMGCASCSATSARVAALTEALRAEIPALLAPDQLARLRATGLRIDENPMLPDQRKRVAFPADVDLMIHRLGGLDLSTATQVSFTLRVEETDQVVVDIDDAPFDREGGAVLLACQHHFDIFPPNTVARVRTRHQSGAETVAEFTILHQFARMSDQGGQ